jgi:hypothetical protein
MGGNVLRFRHLFAGGLEKHEAFQSYGIVCFSGNLSLSPAFVRPIDQRQSVFGISDCCADSSETHTILQ